MSCFIYEKPGFVNKLNKKQNIKHFIRDHKRPPMYRTNARILPLPLQDPPPPPPPTLPTDEQAGSSVMHLTSFVTHAYVTGRFLGTKLFHLLFISRLSNIDFVRNRNEKLFFFFVICPNKSRSVQLFMCLDLAC